MAEKFPRSEQDRVRIQNYGFYEDIFLGQHSVAFSKFSAELAKKNKSMIYIVCNFGGLISKVSADLLFGEQVTFKFSDKTDQKIIDATDEIIKNNKLHTRNYESALQNSYFGDSVMKLRRDVKGNPIIEYLSPELIFVTTDPDNINDIQKIELCWKKVVGKTEYLRKEIHTKGKIENEVWQLAGEELSVKVDLAVVYGQNHNIKESEDTGIDDFMIKLIPNWKTSNRIFGISDYVDLSSLFDEVNNRVTRNADILNRHADPKLAVPKGVLDESGKVKTASFDLFEVTGTDGGIQKPEYVTWDANLDAAFKEIDQMVEFLFLFSETSPSVFGLDKGGTAESGRALKFKLLRTLAKISRKKNYYDEALKWAIKTALQLKGFKKAEEPQIIWADGIPQDTMEAAQIEEIRLRSKNTSLESSIRRLDGGTDEDITAEVEKINKENEASMGEIGRNKPEPNIEPDDMNMDDKNMDGKQPQKNK